MSGDFEVARISGSKLGQLVDKLTVPTGHHYGQTGLDFAEQVLYPQDSMSATSNLGGQDLAFGRHVLLRSVANFAESRRIECVTLIDLESGAHEYSTDLAKAAAEFSQRISLA